MRSRRRDAWFPLGRGYLTVGLARYIFLLTFLSLSSLFLVSSFVGYAKLVKRCVEREGKLKLPPGQLSVYFPRFCKFSLHLSRLAFFGALLNCISIAPLRTICSVFHCANIAQERTPIRPCCQSLDCIFSRRRSSSCCPSPVHNKMPACGHDGRMWLTWPTCSRMQRRFRLCCRSAVQLSGRPQNK